MSKKLALALLLAMVMVITACGQAVTTVAPAPATVAPAPATVAPAPATVAPAPATAAPASKVRELKILWAQWSPSDYLQQIGNMYEQETGIKVTVVQEPWGTFGDRYNTEMAAGGAAWDMVGGDSQWVGQGATAGYYVELTDFLKSNGIDKTVTPATLKYYGEYPANSGKLWAYPLEGDVDAWAYRKDLFTDPANMSAFKAKYGYDLAVPKTWAQLMDIAKFFTQPAKKLYGVAIYTQKDYDAITTGVENVMFSYGAQWQNPADGTVLGTVNSPQFVAALQYYKDLYDCCQVPGLNNAFYTETNDAMIGGQAAMVMNFVGFFPALANKATNPYADVTGYFANPSGPGPLGKQAAALGGQGLNVLAFTSKDRQQASLDFIKWFAQEKIQAEFAKLGGNTCNANVLASDTFKNATPFNPVFSESMNMVMDMWNIPAYAQLLTVSQTDFSAFVVGGQGTAQSTMDQIAKDQDAIMKKAGVYK